MKLIKLKLHNFRCFASEQIINIDDFTAFIGNNSAGKTAALYALNIMFSPHQYERIIRASDFHVPVNEPEPPSHRSLYLEAVFSFDELEQDIDFSNTVPPYFNKMVIDIPEAKPYIRIRLESEWDASTNAEGSIDTKIYYIRSPEASPIADEDKIPARRSDLDRIRMIYIPAYRDPEKQLKNSSGSMMNDLLSSIRWDSTSLETIKSDITKLNQTFLQESGVSEISNAISSSWKNYDPDSRFSNTKLQFNSTDISTFMKTAEVIFSPDEMGNSCTVDRLSDGLKSMLYISLVDSFLSIENKIAQTNPDESDFNRTVPALTLIAAEEPESHIAPHLIGKLIANLQSISSKSNAQVLLSSHSTSVIKRIDPENIRYFRINNGASYIKPIHLPEKTDEKYKYVKEAVKAYPELYFSKLVILGEGDSEEIIIPKLWELEHQDLDISNISVVPLGGRHVNHFWKLLTDLEIPYITLLDLDLGRDEGGWGRIHYALKQLIENGKDRDKLLSVRNGILTDAQFSNMINWDNSKFDYMRGWLKRLEDYGVFYSSPLDIDFLMLKYFGTQYKDMLSATEGPCIEETAGERQKSRIKVRQLEQDKDEMEAHKEAYSQKLNAAVDVTLKKGNTDSNLYDESEKALMIWYSYFFLTRGKPSTHIEALTNISDKELKQNMPPVFQRLFTTATNYLEENK